MGTQKIQTIRNLGQALTTTVSDYVVLDLETTGFSPTNDAIIEVACIKYRSFQEVDRFSTLVNPQRKVDTRICKLTHISNEMLTQAPIFAEVAEQLITFLTNEVIIGHNIRFDLNFLYDNLLKNCHAILNNAYLCTMSLAKTLPLTTLTRYRLCDLVEYFHLENSNAHRAWSDCEATNACYLEMVALMQRSTSVDHQYVDSLATRCSKVSPRS